MNICVTGAGGFVGGHLVNRLVEEGHHVRAFDRKPLGDWWQVNRESLCWDHFDVSDMEAAYFACRDADEVYHLAADMGGMGFISKYKLDCMLSVRASIHMLMGAHFNHTVNRFFYASSACVYPNYRQRHENIRPLRETDAYPADPEDGYGWEKLFTERLCRHFREDSGLETRVARYHNVFGPYGTWEGGREKAPAAICRKVAEAVLTGRHEIEIWGDGEQTRSFLYVDDCVDGTLALARSEHHDPLNIGSEHLVSINELVSMVEKIAGVELDRKYVEGPQGVRGRNSDNTMCKRVLAWEPKMSLEAGLANTYFWVERQIAKAHT